MSENVMIFRGSERQKLPQPKLFRPDRMAEALAEVCERAAPTGRRKYAEKRMGLDPEEARRLIEGRASKAIIDKAFRNAGWSLVLETFALFFDRGVDQHLAQERARHVQQAVRLAQITRDLRVAGSADAGDSLGELASLARGTGTQPRRMGETSSSD